MNKVIKIKNLYKEYQLGVIGHGTLYQDMQSWWARIRGKSDPNSLIDIADPHKNKERILALNNINLEIEEGEILGIIGANGAGKSTLLKILSKVTAPTRGTIKYNGRIASLLEVGTGFHPELTGRENIFLNGAINGMDRKETAKKLDEIIAFSDIGKYIDTPVKRYSSGMYVRLGFAVAVHLDPDILVVDEVLAVGDVEFQKKAIGKMKDVSKGRGRTVLFVSHNIASIKNLCNRCILVDKGSIVKDGNTDEVVNQYLGLNNINNKALYNRDRIKDIKEEKLYENIKYFEIHQVNIADKEGKLKLDFYSDEEIHVLIKFSCLKAVKRFRLGVYVSTRQGMHIMSSIFTDEDSMLGYQNLKPGEYKWSCIIPSNLFGSNEYLFTIGMMAHTVHHINLPNLFLIKTKFLGYNKVLHLVNAPSPIKPKLKWKEF